MFNALNALSERESLLVVKPWVNKWLILAIVVSFSQHFLVMYICRFFSRLDLFRALILFRYTFLGKLVSIAPLTYEEWKLVVAVSAPVCLLEELMKFFVRTLKPNKSI
jgi:Ca2+-transporting ATPase